MERPNETTAPSAADGEGGTDDTVTEDDRGVFERHFRTILVATVLLAAVGGIGVTYLQYGRIAETAAALPFIQASEPPAEDTSATSPPGEYGSFTEMEGLIVNPAGSDGTRYLAVSLAFESSSSSAMQEIKNKEVVVRDAMLNLLSEHTATELSNPDRRTALKDTLRGRTNQLLTSGAVDRLYFTQFVLQ